MNDIDLTGKTVTLVGPMRGQPAFGHPAFDQAHQDLRKRWADNITVWNPAWHDRNELDFRPVRDGLTGNEHLTELGFDIDKARRWCVARIAESDAVILLPGWRESYGAQSESLLAYSLNIPRIELADALAPPAPAPLPEGWHPHPDLLRSATRRDVWIHWPNGSEGLYSFHSAHAWAEEGREFAWAPTFAPAPPWDPEPEPEPWRPAGELADAGLADDAEVLIGFADGGADVVAVRDTGGCFGRWVWMPIPPYRKGGESS